MWVAKYYFLRWILKTIVRTFYSLNLSIIFKRTEGEKLIMYSMKLKRSDSTVQNV